VRKETKLLRRKSWRRRAAKSALRKMRQALAQKKWGPALLPAPTAPSEGSAGVRNLVKNPKAPTRSRSWLTSSGVASDRTAPSCEEPNRSTRLRGPKVRWSFNQSGLTEVKTVRLPRPFLGRPLLRPASLTEIPKNPESRVAREAASSSGASSRLARDEPEGSSHSCRRRSDLWSPAAPFLPLPAFQVRPGPPSRSPAHNARLFRVGEAKISPFELWITGISGTIAGPFPDSRNRPRFGCRSVLLRLVRPGA
jgi:hypothetical protein